MCFDVLQHIILFCGCFDVNMRMFYNYVHYIIMGTTSRDCVTFTVLDVLWPLYWDYS